MYPQGGVQVAGAVGRCCCLRLYEYCIGLRRWVEESTTWGRQLGSAPSPLDFKLEHTGTQGRLPVGVQDPATDVFVDAPLSDSRARHMERIVAEPESWEAVNGQRAVLLLGRCCVPGGRPGLPVGSNKVRSQQQMWSSTCR